jgi:hypothetical protein
MTLDRMLRPLPTESLVLGDEPEDEYSEGVGYVEEDDGSITIDFDPRDIPEIIPHGANLAEYLDDPELASLASELKAGYHSDKQSRKEWERTLVDGLELLGLKIEDRTEPWDGACGVFHPILGESVVRFQAQTIQEIFPARGPVKTKVYGSVDREKAEKANRVREYMNYLLTERMSEYRTETERLLFNLPLEGSAFRKVYYDPTLNRPASMFVPAQDFVVSYGASDLETATRTTHIMKKDVNEVRKLQYSGFYRDVELPEPSTDYSEISRAEEEMTGVSPAVENDHRHTLLEMCVDIDLPGFEDTDEEGEPTGIALPYVVTIDQSSSTVLSIRRNWYEDDAFKRRRVHFAHYQYIPGMGFYGFGLIHLIGGMAKSGTSIIRQLVDAGTLSNLPGGLKSRGLRIQGDDTPIMPGEWRDVDVPGGAIKDNILPLPYKEPSPTLLNLLGIVTDMARGFAAQADIKASEMNTEAPVGTTLALIERSMRVVSALQARLHAAQKTEFKLLVQVIRDFGPTDYPYEVEGRSLVKEDFDPQIDVIPVSNPNSGTMSQKILQVQAALQLAQQDPRGFDMVELKRRMLEVIEIDEVEKILPGSEEVEPMDPVSENQRIISGKPIKAFQYQDHEAHIQVHMAAMQDPKLMQVLAQSPQAQVMQAEIESHIREHVGYQYRREIEKQLGFNLPDSGALPEDIEERLSRLVAPAAEQLLQKDVAEAQQQKAQEAAQDPILAIQRKELELEERKLMQDYQAKMAALEEKRRAAMAREQQSARKMQMEDIHHRQDLAAELADTIGDQQLEAKKIDLDAEAEGAKLGIEMAKGLSNLSE